MSITYPASSVCAPARGREHFSSTDLHLAGPSATDLPGADLREADLQEARLRDTACTPPICAMPTCAAPTSKAPIGCRRPSGCRPGWRQLRAATFSLLTAWPAGFDQLVAGATLTRTEQHD